jgi:hypothetical protein
VHSLCHAVLARCKTARSAAGSLKPGDCSSTNGYTEQHNTVSSTTVQIVLQQDLMATITAPRVVGIMHMHT